MPCKVWWRMLKAAMTNRSIVLLQKFIRRFIAKQTFTKKIEDARRRRKRMASHLIQTLGRTAVRNRIKRSAVTIRRHVIAWYVPIVCFRQGGVIA